MQYDAGSLRNTSTLRTDLICSVKPAQRERIAKQLFFRLQALLHLCRALLCPFITLSLTESASHFNCIAPFLHPCAHLPARTPSPSSPLFHTSLSSSQTLFSCFRTSLVLTHPFILHPSPCCHRSLPLSESLPLSIPLYLFLNSCLDKIVYPSISPNNFHLHPLFFCTSLHTSLSDIPFFHSSILTSFYLHPPDECKNKI